MRFIRALAAFPGGHRTKWVTLAIWLAIGMFAFSLGPKLFGVEKNNADAYLPHTAESTQALDYLNNAPGHPPTQADAVVIYVRDSGITPADTARATADIAAYQSTVPGLAGPVTGPAASADGKALAVSIPVLTPDNVDLGPPMTAINKVAQPGGSAEQNGLGVYVGGAIALNYDANKAFNGLDTTLLFSAGLVVILVLLLTYRSPFLWLLPVICAVFALQLAEAIMYLLVRHAGVVVSGQSGGILTVLVFGVGTDYALLLVARYREELHHYEDKHEAMRIALTRTGPAIVASALTVMFATLGLLVSQLASNAGLGKIGAIGVACALLAMTTLLPALLTIVPRGVFWPSVPRYGTEAHPRIGIWARVSRLVARAPRRIWVGATLLLVVLSLGLVNLHSAQLTNTEAFVSHPPSVTAEQVRLTHFPASGTDPVNVLVNPSGVAQAEAILRADPGLAAAGPGGLTTTPVGSKVLIEVQMAEASDTNAAYSTINRIRPALHSIPGADAQVFGNSAVILDVQASARHDRDWVIPIVLAIAFVILILLLRSLIAPVLLIGSVVASFLAALGASVFIFEILFNQHHEDTSYPLFVFIFLVALGIDYNIFLMTRVREEAARIGTRPGIVKGVAVTGGVITSAGCVLAATFAVLATLPLTQFVQIGFAVAFGVLLDTMLVRSVLVPALCYDIGPRIWWPSRLAAAPPLSLAPTSSGRAGGPSHVAGPRADSG
jgi:RND superfamily putative drug exporter